MEIAVACDGLIVAEHTDRCDSFMCYTANKGVLIGCRNLPNLGLTSQEAADLLIDLGFDIFITGGIDAEMTDRLCSAGIEVIAGISGDPRVVVNDFLDNALTGAVSLCEDDSYGDPAEADIENVFADISERLLSAT